MSSKPFELLAFHMCRRCSVSFSFVLHILIWLEWFYLPIMNISVYLFCKLLLLFNLSFPNLPLLSKRILSALLLNYVLKKKIVLCTRTPSFIIVCSYFEVIKWFSTICGVVAKGKCFMMLPRVTLYFVWSKWTKIFIYFLMWILCLQTIIKTDIKCCMQQLLLMGKFENSLESQCLNSKLWLHANTLSHCGNIRLNLTLSDTHRLFPWGIFHVLKTSNPFEQIEQEIFIFFPFLIESALFFDDEHTWKTHKSNANFISWKSITRLNPFSLVLHERMFKGTL